MSIEANRLAMRRFTEFINTADQKRGEELIAADAQFWVPERPESMKGLAGYMIVLGMMRSGFSDTVVTRRDHRGGRQDCSAIHNDRDT